MRALDRDNYHVNIRRDTLEKSHVSFRLVRLVMVWKAATGFILSSEECLRLLGGKAGNGEKHTNDGAFKQFNTSMNVPLRTAGLSTATYRQMRCESSRPN